MGAPLTDRQRQVLNYLVDVIRKQDFIPSVREIGEALGIRSPSTVHQHLEALQRKGYVRRHGDRMRVLEILDRSLLSPRSDAVVVLPLLGRVAAGQAVLAQEHVEEMIPVPRDMVGWRDECFLLTVRGDSMIEAGILPGDLVVVRCQPAADPGDVVVALIGEEATVKRLAYDGDRPYLQPANRRYGPILEPFEIIGKIVGLMRKYGGDPPSGPGEFRQQDQDGLRDGMKGTPHRA